MSSATVAQDHRAKSAQPAPPDRKGGCDLLDRRLAPATGAAYTAAELVPTLRKFFDAAANRAGCNPGRCRYGCDATTSRCNSFRSSHQPPTPFVKERGDGRKPLANQSSVDHIRWLC